MKKLSFALMLFIATSTTIIVTSIALPTITNAAPKWWKKLVKLIGDITTLIDDFFDFWDSIKNSGGNLSVPTHINQTIDAYNEALANGIRLTTNSIDFPNDIVVASEGNKSILIKKGFYNINSKGISNLVFIAK